MVIFRNVLADDHRRQFEIPPVRIRARRSIPDQISGLAHDVRIFGAEIRTGFRVAFRNVVTAETQENLAIPILAGEFTSFATNAGAIAPSASDAIGCGLQFEMRRMLPAAGLGVGPASGECGGGGIFCGGRGRGRRGDQPRRLRAGAGHAQRQGREGQAQAFRGSRRCCLEVRGNHGVLRSTVHVSRRAYPRGSDATSAARRTMAGRDAEAAAISPQRVPARPSSPAVRRSSRNAASRLCSAATRRN